MVVNAIVRVEVFRERLRLRWSDGGERFTLYLGLPDGMVNRTVAEKKAKTIEGDLATGNFDRTLAKYRPPKQAAEPGLTIAELLERFAAVKARKVEAGTMGKFKALRQPVDAFFGSKSAAAVDDDLADQFRVYLVQQRNLAPATIKERLTTLNACWKWALKKGLVTANPWGEPLRLVKVPPVQKPKPFSQAEISAILKAFRDSKHYAHYADFVEFRFGCGCRIEEAIALKWKHVSEDCSTIWIGEAVTRGKKRKSNKTNRAREFKLSARLQQLLLARRPANCQLGAIVFPAPKGGLLDDHNFSQRIWRKVLAEAGIPHRKFYSARHTFLSHALDRGVKPMTVAEIAGNDPEVLFKHYVSHINGGLQLPDIL